MADLKKKASFEPDDRQREAIEHLAGPMLVIAGAGTGKTTVLIKRIARLILEHSVRPSEILAVTYTDNAAREMRERVESELRGINLTGLQTKTFHAYCNELLIRTHNDFRVLEDADLWVYLRRRIRELELDHFVRAANVSQFLYDLLDFMRRCQDELVTPEKYADYVRRVGCGELPPPRVTKAKESMTLGADEVNGRCQEIANVFAKVERMLRDDNLGTFGHMITHAYALLQRDESVLAEERRRTRFILVDEFQDANFAQVKILQKLAGTDCNVFAVGDPDQAIYRFRGASSAAFGLFQRNFPEGRLVVLEKNRRSTTPILRSAFSLISKNPEVFTGRGSTIAYRRSPLISAREEVANLAGTTLPSIPVDIAFTDKEVESFDLVETLQEKKKQDRAAWKDFAVLYRSHNHRDEVAEELSEKGIPFSIENMDVMDMPEVRDLLACLGTLVSMADGASLFRVAALPQFSVNPEELRAAVRALPRDAANVGMATVLGKITGGSAVLETLQDARDEIIRSNAKAVGVLDLVIKRFNFDRQSRPVEAVVEFVKKWEDKPITKTGQVAELLDYLEYFREGKGTIPLPATEENAVRLMTAHGVKGLEFNHVFVLRARSGSFPVHYREPLFEFPQDLRDPDSVGQGDDKTLNSQEERRLFYVAMTRARDSLTIYGQKGSGKDPTPPGYIRELLTDPVIKKWVRHRRAVEFQTEIFAAASDSTFSSRTSEWLSMTPAVDLSARLSASAVASYERCPLQFKLEREWRLPSDVPAAMQFGATIHTVLKTFFDSVRLERTMSEEDLLDHFRETLSAARIQDPYQNDLYLEQGTAQLKDFYAAYKRSPQLKVLHTEEWFEIPIGKSIVAGRIDRIDQAGDGLVVITDYKTGRPQSQEDADESLQLSIYALAAHEKWGYHADRLAFYNLDGNAAVATGRSQPELDHVRQRVEEVAGNIAAGKFEAKTGFHCKFCAYYNLCPSTEKRLYSLPSAKKKSRSA